MQTLVTENRKSLKGNLYSYKDRFGTVNYTNAEGIVKIEANYPNADLKFILTEMEEKTYKAILDHLDEGEPHFSDLVAEDLALETEIPIKKLRGVLSNLIKKDLISIEEYTSIPMHLMKEVTNYFIYSTEYQNSA